MHSQQSTASIRAIARLTTNHRAAIAETADDLTEIAERLDVLAAEDRLTAADIRIAAIVDHLLESLTATADRHAAIANDLMERLGETQDWHAAIIVESLARSLAETAAETLHLRGLFNEVAEDERPTAVIEPR